LVPANVGGGPVNLVLLGPKNDGTQKAKMYPSVFFVMVVIFGLSACATAPLEQSAAPRSADPSRFTYTRIYCATDSETRFESVVVDLAKIAAAPPAPPIYIIKGGLPATGVNFTAYEPRWGTEDLAKGLYHPAPAPLFAVVLDGAMAIKTSNGDTRYFRVGDVIRVEDVAPCKGHISVNENEQILRIMTAR